jgi:branched-chain amino acid transport system substrate-binding protein
MALLTRTAILLALLAWSTPWPVTAQSKVTIRIATQSPLTSEQAARGDEIRLGAQLALEQLGGPLERLGFRLELAAFDDQGRPDVGVANAKNIVANREILAVVGHLDARVGIPASEIYKEVSLAMISPASTGTLLTDRSLPSVSRVCGRDDVQGTAAAIFAATTLSVKSVYVVHERTTAGQDVAELFRAEAERRGLRILGFEGTDERAELDPVVGLIKARSPDLVFFAGRPEQAGPFWRRAREQGVKARLLGSDGLDSPAFARLAGPAAVGAYYTSVGGPLASLPGGAAFRGDFRRRFGREPGFVAAGAYDAAAIALKAIEAATRGELPSREAVAAAVRKTRLQGVTGEIELDGKGDRRRAVYFVSQVAGEDPGRWEENRVVKQLTAAPPPRR